MTLIEACERSARIISQAHEMDKLYKKAVQSFGEGELQSRILSLAADAVEDECLRQDVFVNNDSMLSFFCGIWLQFLLVEIAGIKKDKLRALAAQVFSESLPERCLH